MGESRSQQLSLDEAAPLLEMFSRLAPVVIVPEHPYEEVGYPSICWIDSPAFRGIASALARYPGPYFWVVARIPPRKCLQVEPNPLRGENPFSPAVFPEVAAKQAVEFERKHFEKVGIHLPWRGSPVLGVPEFKAAVLREIPTVAGYLEKEMTLVGKPSHGVTFSSANFDLPLIEDHPGPGGPIVLVSDLAKYAQQKVSISEYDRVVHYWITEEEEDAIASAISEAGGGDDSRWPLLLEISGAHLAGAGIPPNEIAKLIDESERLPQETRQSRVKDALRRIISVCRSAQNYRLGIYVPVHDC